MEVHAHSHTACKKRPHCNIGKQKSANKGTVEYGHCITKKFTI